MQIKITVNISPYMICCVYMQAQNATVILRRILYDQAAGLNSS